jgi:hypothetical protein
LRRPRPISWAVEPRKEEEEENILLLKFLETPNRTVVSIP